MNLTRSGNLMHPILGAIGSVPVPAKPIHEEPPKVQPFVTLSRQPGAGAWALARHLVDALNDEIPDDQQKWSCWDRELVEKVVADHHLPPRLIDSMEDGGHNWMSDFFGALSFSDSPAAADESKVYSRVPQTIRALALGGRVVIVGRGGVFITRHMPGGIHLRLVAPFEKRVEFMAREYKMTPDKAAAHVKELEHNRLSFYRKHWPNETLSPEHFAMTINTAEVDQPTMLYMLTQVIRSRVPAMAR
jgi:cytidylate kinase